MSNARDELFDWWATTAQQDAEMVVPKSVEYGSNSLEQVGRKVAQLQGRTVDKAEALELGTWMYAVGKMERWTDSVMRGDRVSVDTLTDLGVYATMARRVREAGDWPGRNPGSMCYHGDLDCERCDHHARPQSSGFTVSESDLVDEPDPRAVAFDHMADRTEFARAAKGMQPLLNISVTEKPPCKHENVNVHTTPPEPDNEFGAGTCLDCKREVPVRLPRAFTPHMNGAHE